MYGLAAMVVVFVLAQSVFFLVKAWKQGKKLGISSQTLRGTVTLARLSQPSNVWAAIAVMEPLSFTSVSAEQP